MKAPDAKLMLGLWTAADEAVLTNLREAVSADYAVANFHDAAASIIEEATGNHLACTESGKDANADVQTATGAGAARVDRPAEAS
jgi:hypothetical protein